MTIIATFQAKNGFVAIDIILVNIYVEIISVLLATIWCSGKYWESNTSQASQRGDVAESLNSAVFALPSIPVPSSCTESAVFELKGMEQK